MWTGAQAQENPILLADEPLLLREFVIRSAERILLQPRAIAFVGGEILDVIERVGRGGRSFMRREIADEVGAAARDRLAPIAGVFLEGSGLERIDLIANEAGDHVGSSSVWEPHR